MHHCWFNGTITEFNDTKIHVSDLGLLRGYGLFDYFRTYNQKPFQWDWYWERFEKSAKMLRIPNPIKKEEAFAIVNDLIQKQNEDECAIRFILTGGYAPDSVKMISPNLLICSESLHPSKVEEYENGIKVISHEYVRDIPLIKSIDYKHFMILQQDIKAANASDVIFYKNGDISELSRSNVFMFVGKQLITPNENILFGITRRTVIELARPHFEIIERNISLEELLEADEVFTTSTTKKVLPISQIDDTLINSGKVGEKSKFLLQLINDFVANW
jgi:branched-chain amino acid aminotransferase